MHTGTALPPLINYDSKHELRAFLDERGLGMRKKYGQNFLINPAIRMRLLDALELKPGDHVWEIGPGLGAMTKGLLDRGGQVTAFEIDPAFIGILKEIFAEKLTSGNSFNAEKAFTLIEGDVLKTWPQVKTEEDKDLFLMGNLPYNIAASLLAGFIEKQRFFKRIVVTVQREVALRMAAKPGSADYSSFSVLCSSVYKVNTIQTISASSFYPAPRVDSQGVYLDLLPRRETLPKLFYPLVRGLFLGRRKTIRNTLSQFAASGIIMQEGNIAGREMAAEILARSGISGDRRPETLELHEFAALAAFMEDLFTHGS